MHCVVWLSKAQALKEFDDAIELQRVRTAHAEVLHQKYNDSLSRKKIRDEIAQLANLQKQRERMCLA
ncbi:MULTISPECIES: hypothetical protein [Aminobacterium]|jgi:hypothetical protein|uniref:hypothetical protein n=1 Tax=Aminobacterium TaxID=81466 RepID=UPI00257BC170|nr:MULTISPECIES: hypothetical protein [unclassified Aminobacterium]